MYTYAMMYLLTTVKPHAQFLDSLAELQTFDELLATDDGPMNRCL
jgi:hypothetical protein